MRLTPETRVALDAFNEPIYIAARDGRIAFANGAARADLPFAERLADVVGSDALPALLQLLARAEGTAKPLVGGIALPDRGRVKVFANRLNGGGAEPALMVRFALHEIDRFGALKAKVGQLNEEVRQRRSAEARLREALDERNLLIRELHHRVKNNFQMIVGMIATARRSVAHPAAREALRTAEQRLAAVGAVQQMLYRAEDLRGLPARHFLEAVSRAVLEAQGSATEPTIEGDDSEIDNDIAVPLALMLNELVANALKYGHAERGFLSVRLRSTGDGLRLEVSDRGPGFELSETRERASGIGLVRGLLRQVGGAIEVENNGGARVTVDVRRRTVGGGANER